MKQVYAMPDLMNAWLRLAISVKKLKERQSSTPTKFR